MTLKAKAFVLAVDPPAAGLPSAIVNPLPKVMLSLKLKIVMLAPALAGDGVT
jgi:hypothetical protein